MTNPKQLAFVVILLWIGSAIAGWHNFWPWLAVPVSIIGLHVARTMRQMAALRRHYGFREPTLGGPTSMFRANLMLLLHTFALNLVIFGGGLGLHALLG